jgi:hypothetical protein
MKQSKPKKEAKPKKPHGRPSIHTPELAKEICDTIASSNQALQTLCQTHSNWPSYNAIYEWIADNREGFGDLYAKAKDNQADYLAEEILRIIDKPETYFDENGNERNDVSMMRLKVDAWKWHAMKLKPKKWGELRGQEPANPTETLDKIRDLVADLKKTDASET